MELDDELCLCFHVTKRKILQYLRVRRPKRASQLSQCGGAGTGCGWCRSMLLRLFREANRQGETSAEAGHAEPEPAAEQYARLRADYVRQGKGTPPPGATPLPDEPQGR